MKYIIIGLGNFGSSLGAHLTAMGHEVIGVDNNIHKVDSVKDRMTHAIALDSTDSHAVTTLPLKDTDVVIVAIGEDFGASVMATALFKQLRVKRLISRAMSPLHQTVLEAIGVDEIANPEQDSAERWAKKLEMTGVVNSFGLSEDYNIVEAKMPGKFIGKSLEEANLRGNYDLNVLTIKRMKESKNIFGITQRKPAILGVVSPQTVFEPGDIVVIYGKIADIQRMLQEE